jgi:hypothetical protein
MEIRNFGIVFRQKCFAQIYRRSGDPEQKQKARQLETAYLASLMIIDTTAQFEPCARILEIF